MDDKKPFEVIPGGDDPVNESMDRHPAGGSSELEKGHLRIVSDQDPEMAPESPDTIEDATELPQTGEAVVDFRKRIINRDYTKHRWGGK